MFEILDLEYKDSQAKTFSTAADEYLEDIFFPEALHMEFLTLYEDVLDEMHAEVEVQKASERQARER